jgi:hypothetical protein
MGESIHRVPSIDFVNGSMIINSQGKGGYIAGIFPSSIEKRKHLRVNSLFLSE